MLKFRQYLKNEEKQITACLEREISSLDPVVRPVATHTMQAGGKRIRPFLTILFGRLFGFSSPVLYTLACAMEFIHSATLIHDDIMDAADTRRGQSAAHKVFGTPQAVMAGDVLLASAMQLVIRQENFRVMECYASAVAKTAAGQLEEIQNLHNPALEYSDYLRIITGKTACLISSACEAGAIMAGAPQEAAAAAARFGLQLGIAFQLVDDALDIAPESEIGKPTGGDLREGKFTPVLHYYLQALDSAARAEFSARFAAGSLSGGEVETVVREMRGLGCDEQTRRLADEHIALAEDELRKLPEALEREMLFELAKYVRTRKL